MAIAFNFPMSKKKAIETKIFGMFNIGIGSTDAL